MDTNLKDVIIKACAFSFIVVGGLFSSGLMMLAVVFCWIASLCILFSKKETMDKNYGLPRETYANSNMFGVIAIILALAFFGHWITAVLVAFATIRAYLHPLIMSDE